MKSLIKLNVVFFVLYFFIQFLGNLEPFLVFRIVRSIIELVTILVLGGLNVTVLILLFSKLDLDLWEILSFSSAMSLLFVPLLLTVEFSQFHILFKELPAVNSFLVFLILASSYYFKRKDFIDKFQLAIDKLPKYTAHTLVSSPLFWVSVLNISVTSIIFSAYYALPDLDPFYWIQLYTKDFEEGTIVQLTSHRPLFSSLLYFLNQTSHIDLYAAFKYVLPLLATFTLIPAWLIARKFSSKLLQIVIVLLPLTSSSTILYLQTPTPQAISVISIYYFFFFLIYSWLFNKPIFYYLAGVTILLSFFYHEMATILFTIWLFITVIFNWKSVHEQMRNNKIITLLIALLVISHISSIKNPFIAIYSWIMLAIPYTSSVKLNLLFPAYYININGQSMGWSGLWGVLKYYLYYPGVAIIIFLCAFLYLFVRNKNFKKFVIGLKTSKELLVLITCFLVFFSISEILPRLFSLAYLPDRAWMFTGIFSLTFFFIILKFFKNELRFSHFLVIMFALSMSIGGALYINNFKKYIITDTMIDSAEWVQENLPDNRIIFTAKVNRNLLKYYGQSDFLSVPAEFYFDYDVAREEINRQVVKRTSAKESSGLSDEYSQFIKSNKEDSEKLRLADPAKQKNSVLALLDENIQTSADMRTLLNVEVKQELRPALYIYYSRPNKKNPYIDRPYYAKNIQSEEELIFDQYPDEFQRVYEDRVSSIVIWKIL